MKTKKFGSIAILLCAAMTLSCACRQKARKTENTNNDPVQYTYAIKNTFPHNDTYYTQGLFWHGGALWESTGQYGSSALMEVALETGTPVRSTSLGSDFFGEGSAMIGDRIYMLTWQEGTAFVYDAATLELLTTHRYAGEGWGITTDGEMLYMSDGSSRITVLDPNGFTKKRSINVKMKNRSVRQLNELEWIDGKIWANVYLTDSIVVIDPETGNVEGVIDLTGILPMNDITANTDVLNGIAYDPAGKRVFVTGKNWPKLFEIEIVKK